MMAIFGVAEKLPKEPEPKDMQRLMESMKGKEIEAVVQVMTLRSLPQACYSTENKGHFGIASTCYTHFTSPIRRYPDLMVHRLIRQALRNRLNKSQLKKQTEFLLRAVEHCSETEQNAVETERDTTDLKMTEYMIPFVGEPLMPILQGLPGSAYLSDWITEWKDLFHIDSMDDDEYVYQEDTMTVKGLRGGKKYTMGDAGACDPCQSG